MDISKGYPGIIQAAVLLILLLVIQNVLAAGFLVILGLSPTNPAVLAACNGISIGLILVWGKIRTGAPFLTLYRFLPFKFSLLMPLNLAGFGLTIILSELDNATRHLIQLPEIFTDMLLKIVDQSAASLVLLVVIAPLTEELLFRGLILGGLLSRYSARKAIIASAALFSAFHLNPIQLLPTLGAGLFLAWLFVLLYGLARLFLEAFRGDSWLLPGGVRGAQVLGLVAVLVALKVMGQAKGVAADGDDRSVECA